MVDTCKDRGASRGPGEAGCNEPETERSRAPRVLVTVAGVDFFLIVPAPAANVGTVAREAAVVLRGVAYAPGVGVAKTDLIVAAWPLLWGVLYTSKRGSSKTATSEGAFCSGGGGEARSLPPVRLALNGATLFEGGGPTAGLEFEADSVASGRAVAAVVLIRPSKDGVVADFTLASS